jgi:hypothetical protein
MIAAKRPRAHPAAVAVQEAAQSPAGRDAITAAATGAMTASIVTALPTIIAAAVQLASLVWIILRIYETHTIQNLVHRVRQRIKRRKSRRA